jgi:hypothetical protein
VFDIRPDAVEKYRAPGIGLAAGHEARYPVSATRARYGDFVSRRLRQAEGAAQRRPRRVGLRPMPHHAQGAGPAP